MKKENKVSISAEEFDAKFDAGEDMADYVDWSQSVKRINLDVPLWALKAMDKEANRRGIARQALIKTWLIDKLDSLEKGSKEVM